MNKRCIYDGASLLHLGAIKNLEIFFYQVFLISFKVKNTIEIENFLPKPALAQTIPKEEEEKKL